jgi:chemotaxis protein MotB
MAKRKAEESESNVADSIFGDLMCQMLTFFILLYTTVAMNVSETEGQQETKENIIEQIKTGFRSRLKLTEEVVVKEEEEPKDPIIQIEEAKVEELEVDVKNQIISKIRQVVERETLKKYIEVVVEEQKIRLIFNQPILFTSGYAYLRPGSSNFLDPVIKDILMTIDNEVIIEGHTDNIPIHNDMYRDNWELSFDRAYNVLRYMVYKHKMNPERVSAIGYGEYRPRVENDTRENRAKNRRIEVNILLHSNKIDADKAID